MRQHINIGRLLILGVTLILGKVTLTEAQTFPVQISTSIVPPYSLRLADYGTTDRFYTTILFNDPVKPDLQVKLRFTIEGQGITIQTKQEFLPPPLFIQAGIPEQFTSVDFADYFNPNNLNFQGLDRGAFIKSGQLPEGIYRICIEVIEYTQNKKVSNSGCVTSWMVLNDPPIINYPRNNEKLTIRDPQQIIFNWTPRHTGSPNSAFATEYEFELVEMRSGNTNPNYAIQTSPPIFTTSTQQTSLVYSLGETALIPGQQYAFRVRAKPTVENENFDLFKNNGYSEVFTFTYGDVCLEPTGLTAEANSAMSFITKWNASPVHNNFTLRYKENTSGATWYETPSTESEITISKLKSNTEYIVELIGVCGVTISEASETITVRTNAIAESNFVCGANESEIDLSNTTPIKNLQPNTVIYSGDFTIKLTEVIDNGGSYSGKGIAVIPWFKLAGIKVSFSDIEVNEERRVIQGKIGSVQSENSSWVYTGNGTSEGTNTNTNNQNNTNNTNNNESEINNTNNTETDSGVITDGSSETGNTDNQTGIVGTGNGDQNTSNGNTNSEGTSTGNSDNSTSSSEGSSTTSTAGGNSSSGSGNGSVGGGNASGSGGQSGNSSNTANAGDWNPNSGEFGPIKVTYSNDPVKTTDATCSYQAKAAFEIGLDGTEGISMPIEFKNVTIDYELDCTDESFLSAKFTWEDSEEPLTKELGVLVLSAKSMVLDINKKKVITGTVNLYSNVKEDISLSNSPQYSAIETPLDITLKKGLEGNCSFSLSYKANSSKLTGSWDFSGIKGLNLDLSHDNKVVAQLKNGSLNKEGIVSASLEIKKKLEWSEESYAASIELNNLDIEFSPFKGMDSWDIKKGKMTATLSEMKSIEGEITSELEYTGTNFTAKASSDNLQGFGMSINNIDLTAQFSKHLSFESVKGKFTVKHPQFDSKVNVTAFEFLPTGLKTINLNGEFTYNEYTVKLQNTKYIKDDKLLSGSASVVSGSGDDRSVLAVDGFKIHEDGTVEMGEVSGDFSSGNMFGPLRVTMSIPKVEAHDNDGYAIYKDVKGSFLLNLEATDDAVEELAISEALVSFKLHPETKAYKDVDISWTGDINIGKVGYVSGTIKKLNLKVDEDGNLSGTITCDARLEEDLSFASLAQNENSDLDLILYKDLEGQIEFSFSNSKSFEGSWKLNKLSNLNGDLKKNGKGIAKFTNGQIDESQQLSGHLEALPGASFQNRQCKIEVTKLDMDFSVSMAEGIKSFTVSSGAGAMTLSEMQGVEGELDIELNYLNAKHFSTKVKQSKKSQINAFGMTLTKLQLNAVVDTKFNLISIKGSLVAHHPKTGEGDITIKKFAINEGRLSDFQGSGKVVYEKFNFDLTEIKYKNDGAVSSLIANASVIMKLGKDAQNLSVEKFEIDKDGEISVGRVKGEFKKGNAFLVAFDATFAESQFKGSFTGKLGMIDLKGNIDMGTAENDQKEPYNYGYLAVSSSLKQGGIPLGATGLKLTKIGGQAGINYRLNSATNTGSAAESNYVAGLTLGLADLANICEVSGNPVVQIGPSDFEFKLKGDIKIPRTPPHLVEGNLEVLYNYPEESLVGSTTFQVSIPPKSGFLLTAKPELAFNFQESHWSLKGSNTGLLFKAITFTGSIDLEDNAGFHAKLDGNISYSKTLEYKKNLSVFGYELNTDASIKVGCSSDVKLSFTENDLETAFSLEVTGKGKLDVSGSIDYNLSVQASGKMEVEYANQKARLQGELLLRVDEGKDKGKEHTLSIDTEL